MNVAADSDIEFIALPVLQVSRERSRVGDVKTLFIEVISGACKSPAA